MGCSIIQNDYLNSNKKEYLVKKEDLLPEELSLEEHVEGESTEIIGQEPVFTDVMYNQHNKYQPLDLEEVWDYQSIKEVSKEEEYKSPEVMDDEEVEEAVVEVQMAHVTGDFQSISYEDRKRLANTALYDPIGVRIQHALNRITLDIDFSRIY